MEITQSHTCQLQKKKKKKGQEKLCNKKVAHLCVPQNKQFHLLSFVNWLELTSAFIRGKENNTALQIAMASFI